MNLPIDNKTITFSKHLQTAESFEEKTKAKDAEKAAMQQWNEMADGESADAERHMNSYYKVYHRINQEKRNRQQDLRKLIIRYAAIAAVLVVAFFITSTWMNPQQLQTTQQAMLIESPEGVRTRFFLPDGSNGWLNCGSSIQFTTDKKGRRVELQGEAFFDVAKQNGKPFDVITNQLKIRVLGTRFNVYSYPEEDLSEVVLQSGSVSVVSKASAKNTVMKPGELYRYHSSQNQASLSKVNAAASLDWINGTIRFNNEALRLLIPKIERFYHVDIEIGSNELLDYTFYGQVSNEPIENLLELMQLAIPMNYSIEKRTQTNNGEFLKRKVVLLLKK